MLKFGKTDYCPSFYSATKRSAEKAVLNLALVDLDVIGFDEVWEDIKDYKIDDND